MMKYSFIKGPLCTVRAQFLLDLARINPSGQLWYSDCDVDAADSSTFQPHHVKEWQLPGLLGRHAGPWTTGLHFTVSKSRGWVWGRRVQTVVLWVMSAVRPDRRNRSSGSSWWNSWFMKTKIIKLVFFAGVRLNSLCCSDALWELAGDASASLSNHTFKAFILNICQIRLQTRAENVKVFRKIERQRWEWDEETYDFCTISYHFPPHKALAAHTQLFLVDFYTAGGWK